MRNATVIASLGLFLVFAPLHRLNGLADETSSENDSSGELTFSTVPEHVPTVPDSIIQHLSVALQEVNEAHGRNDLEGAQQSLKEIAVYCRKNLGQDHYLAYQYDSAAAWYKWYAGLSESQRTSYREAGPILVDGEQAFAKADFELAVNKYQQGIDVIDRLKMPAFGDYANYELGSSIMSQRQTTRVHFTSLQGLHECR
jgi:hypothetical protein